MYKHHNRNDNCIEHKMNLKSSTIQEPLINIMLGIFLATTSYSIRVRFP
jgi:hypothetical protein